MRQSRRIDQAPLMQARSGPTIGKAGGANAVLINYDDNVAGTAAAQSIVLVGVTALTSVTDALLTV